MSSPSNQGWDVSISGRKSSHTRNVPIIQKGGVPPLKGLLFHKYQTVRESE